MPGLIVHSEKPFNAETPLDQLRGACTTQQRDFYVRSHGGVPALNEDSHSADDARPGRTAAGAVASGWLSAFGRADLQCSMVRRNTERPG
jgi:hypothetical protein